MKERPCPDNKRSATHPLLVVGEPFDPNREVCGFYPPDVVARQPNLTDGQKRLYERGVRWAGRNGHFWYGFDTMAKELGKSARQVKRDIKVLEAVALMKHVRRGRTETNDYRFLYNAMFESEVTSTSHHPQSEVTDLPSEVTSTSPGEVTPASLESCKKNYVRESSSSESSASDRKAGTPSDDDPLFQEKEKADPESVLELVLSDIESVSADPLMGAGPLPRSFLQVAARSIHASKCFTGFGRVDLALYPPPDLGFTAKIAEPWRGKGSLAFADWVCSTAERQLGRKAKATGSMAYGLFLADSTASARTWTPGSMLSRRLSVEVSAQRLEATQRIERERRSQLMETSVRLADAIRILDSEAPEWGRKASTRFLWLMERRVNEISPDDLLAAAMASQKCRKCNDVGIIGSPLKGTLTFCNCDFGEQEHLERGDEFIAGEIHRVNSTLRSRLTQACRELGPVNTIAFGASKDIQRQANRPLRRAWPPDAQKRLQLWRE